MQDHRKYRRLPVEPLIARVLQEGQVLDLSIGGAFIMTARPLQAGAQVTLEIALPGERAVRPQCVVEWSGEYLRGETGLAVTGMGLRFVGIELEDRLAITRFLKARYEAAHAALRVHASLPARIGDEGRWVAGSVREIGERTLFIETAAQAPIGTEIDILIRFPNFRAPVAGRGVVLKAVAPAAPGTENGGGPSDGHADQRGLVIELRELTPRGRDVMNVFIDEAAREGPEAAPGS